jgi:hypothetical protein
MEIFQRRAHKKFAVAFKMKCEENLINDFFALTAFNEKWELKWNSHYSEGKISGENPWDLMIFFCGI